jgi:hypothetical protein
MTWGQAFESILHRYNVGGAMLWAVLFVGAGYLFGNLPFVQVQAFLDDLTTTARTHGVTWGSVMSLSSMSY